MVRAYTLFALLTKSEVNMVCPDCNGEKELKIFPKLIYGKIISTIPCERCTSTGMVPSIQSTWIEEGKKLIEDRNSRKITLRDEAKRLGIDPLEYSQAEQGRIDPSFILNKRPTIIPNNINFPYPKSEQNYKG